MVPKRKKIVYFYFFKEQDALFGGLEAGRRKEVCTSWTHNEKVRMVSS
jgi:hypothetical protein